MAETGPGDFEYGVRFAVDAAGLVTDLGSAATRGGRVFNDRLGDAFDIGDAARRKFADGAIGRMAGAAGRNAGTQFTNQFEQRFRRAIPDLGAQVGALQKQVAAQMSSLGRLGVDKDMFAGVNEQLRVTIEELDNLRQAQARGLSPVEVDQYARAVEAAMGHVRGELRSVEPVMRQILEAQQKGRSQMVLQGQRQTTLMNAQIRTEGAQAVAATQASARQRLQVYRQLWRQIEFIERQAAAAIRGTIRLTGTLLTGLGKSIAQLGSTAAAGLSRLTSGLRGALGHRERALADSFGRQTKIVRSNMDQQTRIVQSAEQKMSKGLAGILSGQSRLSGALGIGGLVGGGLLGGGLISAGLERFTALERITIQLERLTGSASKTRDALAEIVKLAELTPLGLTDLSQATVGIVAMGVSIQDALPAVEALADAIGFTGGGAQNLERVGLALRQIASTGKLQGDEFNQLAENLPGLNIRQLLADQITEGSQSALVKMQEAGDLSASTFIDGFIKALKSDERIVGAATSTVDTLGGQIAIAKEAFETLGASVIGAMEPFLRFSLEGTIERLTFLSNFIKGDVSPQLMVLREALKGVAVALGALIAAKAAVETLGLLSIVLRSMVTPLGLLVTTFAALGAAIILLRKASPAFKAFTDGIVDVVTSGEFLGALADLFTERLLPAVVDLARRVAGVLAPAFRAVGSIIKDDVLPVLREVDDFLGALFSGDMGRVKAQLKAIADGLLNVANSVVDALGGLAKRGGDALLGIFGDVNESDVAMAVLGFVNKVGNSLAKFLTSERLMAVGVNLALVATALAAVFLAGFVQGLMEGIPGAVTGFFDALGGALSTAGLPSIVSNVFGNVFTGLPALLIAGLAISSLVSRVTSQFKAVGTAGAAGFGQGFTQRFRGITQAFSGDFSNMLAQSGIKGFNSIQQQITTLEGRFRRLGVTGFSTFGVGQEKLDQLTNKMRSLETQFGKATIQAGLFRANLRQMFTGIEGMGRLEGRLQAFRNLIADQGGWAVAGQKAGIAVVGAMGAAMAGSQGFTGAAFMGIASSALITGLTAGPVAGALVGAVGLVVAAFNDGKQAAQEFRAEVKLLADAFLEAEGAIERQAAIVDTYVQSFDRMSDAQRNLFLSAGVQNWATEIEQGALTQEEAFVRLAGSLGLTRQQSQELFDDIGGNLGLLRNSAALTNQYGDDVKFFVEALDAAKLTGEDFWVVLDEVTQSIAKTGDAHLVAADKAAAQGEQYAKDIPTLSEYDSKLKNIANTLLGQSGLEGPSLTLGQVEGEADMQGFVSNALAVLKDFDIPLTRVTDLYGDLADRLREANIEFDPFRLREYLNELIAQEQAAQVLSDTWATLARQQNDYIDFLEGRAGSNNSIIPEGEAERLQELSDKMREWRNEVASAFSGAQSIAMSFSDDARESASAFIEELHTSGNAARDWADDVAVIYRLAAQSGSEYAMQAAQYIGELGPEYAEMVEDLRTQLESGEISIQEFVDAIESNLRGQSPTAILDAMGLNGLDDYILGQVGDVAAAAEILADVPRQVFENQQEALKGAASKGMTEGWPEGSKAGKIMARAAADDLVAAYKENMAGVSTASTEAMEAGAASAKGQVYLFRNVGHEAIAGVAQGITASQALVSSALIRAMNRAVAEAKKDYIIQSPSKVMADLIGLPMIQGVAQGIIDGTPEAIIASKLAAGEIDEAMADEMRAQNEAVEESKNMAERVAEAIIDEWESQKQAIADAMEDMLRAAEAKLDDAWKRITDKFERIDMFESMDDLKRELKKIQDEIAANQKLLANPAAALSASNNAIKTAKEQLAEANRLLADLDAREKAAQERVNRAEVLLDDPTLTFLERSAAQQELINARNALDLIEAERSARTGAVSDAERAVEEAVKNYQDVIQQIADAREAMPGLEEQLSDHLARIRDEWFDILQFMLENDLTTWNGQSLDQIRQLAGVTQDEWLRLLDAIRQVDRAESNLNNVNLTVNFPETFTIEIEGQPITVSLTAETIALLQQLEVTIGN